MAYLQKIDNIFNREECKTLIKRAKKTGFKTIDRGIAVYDRAMIVDKELAADLFNRVKQYIPAMINGFKVVGLNDHFRFSKYHPGGKFDVHKDGFNQDSQGNRSVWTLNIFLNRDFDGGETVFYYDTMQHRFTAKPKRGRGMLFDSQQYHCGNQVSNGKKYLIRTDVMIRPY